MTTNRKLLSHRVYGIKKRVLLYSIGLLLFVLLAATASVNMIIHRYMKDMVKEKYEYVNEKMMLAMENEYAESNDLTSEYIASSNIQSSLENREMNQMEYSLLKKKLAYLTCADLANLFYMDNKGNVYTRMSGTFNRDEFLHSELYQGLGEEYSKTKWIWTKDVLFQEGEKALFIGRYVRHMEYSHDPGVIFLKMNDDYFDHMFESIEKEEKVAYMVFDSEGNLCYSYYRDAGSDATWMQTIQKEFLKYRSRVALKENQMITLDKGILFSQKEENTSFYIVTYVPNAVMNQPLRNIQFGIMVAFLGLCLVAILFSICLSNSITKPVKKINDVMNQFDGTNFNDKLQLATNTELDSIGHTYNRMIDKISMLIQQNKENERELRIRELNSLMYQLNPHFLYNTLDNIYMLARMNGDQRTMDMIQSLSKLLRISLSKGQDMIELKEELEHVKCYLEIQKIRNASLFDYTIECSETLLKVKVLKLILQPIVENGIKHGFCDIYEGGHIWIQIAESSKEGEENLYLKIRIRNNGKPMEEEVKRLLNQMQLDDINEIKNYFSKKQGGYGIANVVSRLRLNYQEKIEYYYQDTEDEEGTECVIVIPKVL